MTVEPELFELSASQQGLFSAYKTVALPPAVRFYELGPTVTPETLREAFERCRLAEPALRLELVQDAEGWYQSFPDRPVAWHEILDTAGQGVASVARRVAIEAIASMATGDTPPRAVSAFVVSDEDGSESRILVLLVDRYAIDGRGFDLLEQRLGEQLHSPVAIEDRSEQAHAELDPSERGAPTGSEKLVESLFDATVATGSAVPTEPADPRREVVRAELDPRWQRTLASAGISTAMAFVGAHAILLGVARSAPTAVVNVPLADRSMPSRRDVIGRFATLVHVPVAMPDGATVEEFRKGLRNAMLTAIRFRRVDPGLVYKALYERLPTWPPGWNSICSVFETPRWSGSDLLRPLDAGFWDPSNEAPGMLVTNVRLAPTAMEADWAWDANCWPDGSGARFQQLVERLCSAPGGSRLADLASI